MSLFAIVVGPAGTPGAQEDRAGCAEAIRSSEVIGLDSRHCIAMATVAALAQIHRWQSGGSRARTSWRLRTRRQNGGLARRVPFSPSSRWLHTLAGGSGEAEVPVAADPNRKCASSAVISFVLRSSEGRQGFGARGRRLGLLIHESVLFRSTCAAQSESRYVYAHSIRCTAKEVPLLGRHRQRDLERSERCLPAVGHFTPHRCLRSRAAMVRGGQCRTCPPRTSASSLREFASALGAGASR